MASFSPGELEVMRVLWELGDGKPSEIQARFPRPIQNAALRFQLRVLLEKGHVKRRRVGKAYSYAALTPRVGAFTNMAKRMADAFTKGSTAGLIAELIRTENLSAGEIRHLQKVAAARAKEKARKPNGGKKG